MTAPIVPQNAVAASKISHPFVTDRGQPRPFGATPRSRGVNFAVFSRHATSVQLLLFQPGVEEPFAEIPLGPGLHKTGDIWHIFVMNVKPDMLYAYRMNGVFAPKAGHRFDPKAMVLDPYARAISGGHRWGVPDAAHIRTARTRNRRVRL